MDLFSSLLVFSLCLSVFADDIIVYNRSSIPIQPFTSKALIDVYYLEVPLFHDSLGNTLEKLDAFHGGVGFKLREGRADWEQFALEYYADPDFMGAVFPEVVNNEVAWNACAVVGFLPNINSSKWLNAHLMGTIEGEVFNDFLCWVPIYAQTHSQYLLWNINLNGERIIQSSTCVDFVEKSLNIMKMLGASIQSVLPTRKDVVSLYSNSSLIKVDKTNQTEWGSVLSYYNGLSAWRQDQNETLIEKMESLFALLEGTFYIYVNASCGSEGEYFKFSSVSPFASLTYSLLQLNTSSDPSNVEMETSAVCPAKPISQSNTNNDDDDDLFFQICSFGLLPLFVIATIVFAWLYFKKTNSKHTFVEF